MTFDKARQEILLFAGQENLLFELFLQVNEKFATEDLDNLLVIFFIYQPVLSSEHEDEITLFPDRDHVHARNRGGK